MGYVSGQKKPVAPTSNHGYWGRFTVAASFPNVAGAALQDPSVDYGDLAWSDANGQLYECTLPTPGTATWVPVGSTAGATPAATMHLYQGDLVNLTLGTPDTPTPDAMRLFGQENIHTSLTISAIHTHWITVPAGGGPVSIEVYRAQGILTGGPIVWTKIGTITTTPTGVMQNFVFDGISPALDVDSGDYLFAQAIAKNNAFEGLTLDFHFAQPT